MSDILNKNKEDSSICEQYGYLSFYKFAWTFVKDVYEFIYKLITEIQKVVFARREKRTCLILTDSALYIIRQSNRISKRSWKYRIRLFYTQYQGTYCLPLLLCALFLCLNETKRCVINRNLMSRDNFSSRTIRSSNDSNRTDTLTK